MTDEMKYIDVHLGPYRDKRLLVSAADAESAVNNHWARDPHEVEDPDHPHPPLDDAERQAALESANAWAQAQWDVAQGVDKPPEPPPEGGEGEGEGEGGITRRKRAMKPEDSPDYKTRHIEHPARHPEPKRE